MSITTSNLASTAESARVTLERGALGVKWGASATEIMAIHPSAKQLATGMIAVIAPEGFLGVRATMGDIFILMVNPKAGLTNLGFQIAAQDVHDFVKTLRAQLGPGRSAVVKTMFGTFEHAYEWSTAKFGVVLAFSTKDGAPHSVPLGMGTVQLRQGPLTESMVEMLEKSVIRIPPSSDDGKRQ